MSKPRKLHPLVRALVNDLIIILLAMGILFLILMILAQVHPR
jgi:hypothetical protein